MNESNYKNIVNIGAWITMLILCLVLWAFIGASATLTITIALIIISLIFLQKYIGGWYPWVMLALIGWLAYSSVNLVYERNFPFTVKMMQYAYLNWDLKIGSWLNNEPVRAKQTLLDCHKDYDNRVAQTVREAYRDGNPQKAIKMVEDLKRLDADVDKAIRGTKPPTPTTPQVAQEEHSNKPIRKTSKVFEPLEDGVYTFPVNPHEITSWYTIAWDKKWTYQEITSSPFGVQPFNGETIWYDGTHNKFVNYGEQTPTIRFISVNKPIIITIYVEPRRHTEGQRGG